MDAQKELSIEKSKGKMDNELLKTLKLFSNIEDKRASNATYRLSDTFMSGLAMFSLQYSSLLDFDQQTSIERENLRRIFGIDKVCSDTHLRTTLDTQSPDIIRPFFADRFEDLQSTGLFIGQATTEADQNFNF